MRIIKLTAILLLTFTASMYFISCSSAEQTTGKLAYDRGDFKKAEEEFQKEVKQNVNNEEAWFYLGASRIQLGKFNEAQEAFDSYRKIGKNSFADKILEAWVLRFNSGADNFEKGQKAKDDKEKVRLFTISVEDFKVCKIIQPDSTVVEQYITSINSKIVMITVNPIIDKGVAYFNEGKYEEALKEYNTAMEKLDKNSPGYEVVAYNIAITYLKWGETMRTANDQDMTYKEKFAAAKPYLEDLTKSLDLETQYKAWEFLVSVYGSLSENEKALDAIKKRDEVKALLDKKKENK